MSASVKIDAPLLVYYGHRFSVSRALKRKGEES